MLPCPGQLATALAIATRAQNERRSASKALNLRVVGRYAARMNAEANVKVEVYIFDALTQELHVANARSLRSVLGELERGRCALDRDDGVCWQQVRNAETDTASAATKVYNFEVFRLLP